MQTKQIIATWYDSHLADIVNRTAGPAIAAQLGAGVGDLSARLDAAGQADPAAVVDAWFTQQIKRPPLSYDTSLYNQVRAAVEALKAQLPAPSPAPASAQPEAVSEPAAAAGNPSA